MSVTVMMAVAVLERPKFRLPSMSVACTMMVYWDTFCKRKKKKRNNTLCGYSSAKSSLSSSTLQQHSQTVTPEEQKSEYVFCSIVAVHNVI